MKRKSLICWLLVASLILANQNWFVKNSFAKEDSDLFGDWDWEISEGELDPEKWVIGGVVALASGFSLKPIYNLDLKIDLGRKASTIAVTNRTKPTIILGTGGTIDWQQAANIAKTPRETTWINVGLKLKSGDKTYSTAIKQFIQSLQLYGEKNDMEISYLRFPETRARVADLRNLDQEFAKIERYAGNGGISSFTVSVRYTGSQQFGGLQTAISTIKGKADNVIELMDVNHYLPPGARINELIRIEESARTKGFLRLLGFNLATLAAVSGLAVIGIDIYQLVRLNKELRDM